MKKYIKFILLILWALLIYYFSSEPSTQSSDLTNGVLKIVYDILRPFIESKIDFQTFNNIVFIPIRKIAHFSEYCILGILLYINIKPYSNKYIIYSFIASLLYAISDEIHQYFVPGRACKLFDIFVDLFGAITGLFIVHSIFKHFENK